MIMEETEDTQESNDGGWVWKNSQLWVMIVSEIWYN